MEFQYKPLPSDSVAIRILELHPGRRGEKIACSLQQISFPPADGETYEPLSYYWGDSRDKVSIIVENCSFEVTRNLHAALDRLRLTDKKRRMWVDAICINQDDDIEKTKRVQMMREIYSYGKETLLWMGPGSRHSYISSSWNLIPKVVNGTFKYSVLDPVKNYLSLGHYNNIPGLISIFLLPYFTRVWAIQEVAASPLVRVYYGDNESYSWDDLDPVVEDSSDWSHYSYGTRAFFGAFMNIDMARDWFQIKSMPGFHQLLEDHRFASATLAKDKIYGLLGLLPPEERELYGIVPNYLE